MAIIEKFNKYIRVEIFEIIFYISYIVVATGLIPLAIGLGGKAFEQSFTGGSFLSLKDYLGTYVVYYIFITISLFLIIFPIARLIFLKRGEHVANLEKPRFYHIFCVDYIFNPEHSVLWYLSEKLGFKDNKNLMRWSKSFLRVFVIFILFFGILMLTRTAFPKQLAFLVGSDTPQIVMQQITVLSEVVFATEPASTSESCTMAFLLFLVFGITAYFCAKFKLKFLGFALIGLFIVSPLVGGGGWAMIHKIVYGNQEASLFATWVFGTSASMLMLLFGTIFIFIIFHEMNNSMSQLAKIVTQREDLLFIGFIIWFLILIFYVLLEFYLRSKKKKIGEDTYFET